jgi:hypothetical protein
MRAAVSCALALLAAGALHSTEVAGAPTVNAQADVIRPKASSFAPHPGAHSRVYGAPIQSRILKSHPKKKPQVTSTPLPDTASAPTPSGG